MYPLASLILVLLPAALAHRAGRAQEAVVSPDADWATKHLAGVLSLILVALLHSSLAPPCTPSTTSPLNPALLTPPTEEHHISNFDAGAFFSLHDFDSSGGWTPDEVRRTYGLDDESLEDVTDDKREEVTREVFKIFDADKNGVIEREEWMVRSARGARLPDFGVSGFEVLGKWWRG